MHENFNKRGRFGARALAAVLAGTLALGGALPAALAQQGQPGEVSLSAQAELPSRYDMRADGVVTPVKQQSPWGTCWAFGSIAAAETSILSSTGKTYAESQLDLSEKHLAWFSKTPLTEEERPDQAGEGLHRLDEGADPNSIVNGGFPVYVSTLFSSGVGPMMESTWPYRGANGWLESDWMTGHEDEWKQEEREKLAQSYPDMDAAEVKETVDSEYQRILGLYTASDCYASHDDWTLPALDADGNWSRFQFAGYTLRDGNTLPEPAVRDEAALETGQAVGPWLGVSEDGMRAMKQEIINGRAISISYHADTSLPGEGETGTYINLDNWAHYTYDDINLNHTVCVVGWDDNYPAQNFAHAVTTTDEAGNKVVDEQRTALTTPPGNGAWLVKNSWGSQTDAVAGGLKRADGSTVPANYGEWGIQDETGRHSGYFWLSYYDKSITRAESYAFDTDFSDSAIYSMAYDYLPGEAGFWELHSKDVMSTASEFPVDQDVSLRAVSTRTSEDNTRVTFAIYALDADERNPERGELLATFSENFAYAGFHRVNLPTPLAIKAGQLVSVVATESVVADDGTRTYGASAAQALSEDFVRAAVEEYPELAEQLTNYGVAVVNPGESFLKIGPNWTDWADYQKTEEFAAMTSEEGVQLYEVDNFAIKAYAAPTATE